MRFVACLLSLLFFMTTAFADNSTTDTGKNIYQFACATCHAPDKAKFMKAPAAFNAQAWAPVMANAKTQIAKQPKKYSDTYQYLLVQVKQGKGMMRHGGLCFENQKTNKDCSDPALIAAIKYMIPST